MGQNFTNRFFNISGQIWIAGLRTRYVWVHLFVSLQILIDRISQDLQYLNITCENYGANQFVHFQARHSQKKIILRCLGFSDLSSVEFCYNRYHKTSLFIVCNCNIGKAAYLILNKNLDIRMTSIVFLQ